MAHGYMAHGSNDEFSTDYRVQLSRCISRACAGGPLWGGSALGVLRLVLCLALPPLHAFKGGLLAQPAHPLEGGLLDQPPYALPLFDSGW